MGEISPSASWYTLQLTICVTHSLLSKLGRHDDRMFGFDFRLFLRWMTWSFWSLWLLISRADVLPLSVVSSAAAAGVDDDEQIQICTDSPQHPRPKWRIPRFSVSRRVISRHSGHFPQPKPFHL
jgi:hypothetical protein